MPRGIPADLGHGVNPVKPMLYYSRGGDIYRLNYDGGNFDASPYISLGSDFDVKQIVFNPFDANTVYIAADNLGEAGEMKALGVCLRRVGQHLGRKTLRRPSGRRLGQTVDLQG